MDLEVCLKVGIFSQDVKLSSEETGLNRLDSY